jgi:hypothetical protein
MRRHAVAAIAIVLGLAALALWIWPQGDAGDALMGPLFRVALVMGAWWLAYADVERLPVWGLAIFPALLLVVAVKPKWLLIALPIIIALAILRPRAPRKR